LQHGCAAQNKLHEENTTVKGFLKTVTPYESKFGKTYAFVVVSAETGTEETIVPGGTAKYTAMNLAQHLGLEAKQEKDASNVARDAKLLGHYVEIAPNSSYKNKTGQMVKSYEVRVDTEKTLDNLPF